MLRRSVGSLRLSATISSSFSQPQSVVLCRTSSAVARSGSRFRSFSSSTFPFPLSDPSLFKPFSFINGEFVGSSSASSSPLTVFNPATRQALGTIPSLTTKDTEHAVTSSLAAFSTFQNVSAADRAAMLAKWGALMRQHKQDLATILTAEQGKPLAEAAGEIEYAASFLSVYSGEATRIRGDVLHPGATNPTRILTIKQPIGVVAAITPWNFPAAMITRKVGAAIAAGCPVVLKPSELTPYSATALAELALRAGVPSGVFQVVTGLPAQIGPVLTQHPAIRKITFTGSTRVGKLLASESSSTVKKLSLELGGNAPFVIFDDADIPAAVAGVIASKYRNAGQTCVCANRIFVQDKIYLNFMEALRVAVAALKVGDGMAPGSLIGPLINAAACAKVEQHIDDAVAKGGEIIHGRKTRYSPARGLSDQFCEPTIVANATPEMLPFRDETFGPVAFVYKFSSDDQAIAMANNTTAGLAAYLYTSSARRQWSAMERLEYGMVGVNTGSVSVPSAPFGGVKESGFGREGGHVALDDFLVLKTAHFGL